MLNSEQASFIEGLKVNNPGLDLTALRGALKEANWSDEDVEVAISRYTGIPVVPQPSLNIPQVNTPPETPAHTETPGAATSAYTPLSQQRYPQDYNFGMHQSGKILDDRPQRSFSLPISRKAIAGVIIALTVGATATLGYFIIDRLNFFGPPTLTDENIISTLSTKFSEIERTNYDATFSFAVGTRDQGALSYGEAFPMSKEETERYRRDYDRLRDISEIKNSLDSISSGGGGYYYSGSGYDETKKTYPSSLGKLGVRTIDPLGKPYDYKTINGGSDYELIVTFETTEAYELVNRYSDVWYLTPTVPRDDTPRDLPKNTAIITKETYINTYGFSETPEQPALFGLDAMSETERYLPPDIAVNISLGGSIDSTTDNPTDARAHLSGDVSFGDAQFSFDAEGIKDDAQYYAIVNKIPALFGDLSSIRGLWFTFTESDLLNYGLGDIIELYGVGETGRQEKEKIGQLIGKIVLEAAEKHTIISITSGPKNDTIDGQSYDRYTLALKRDNLIPFVDEVFKNLKASPELKDLVDTDELDEAYKHIRTELESDPFKRSFDYLRDNLTFTLWMDADGYPARIEQDVRYIPSPQATKLRNSQMNLTFTIALTDINRKLEVTPPADAISFEEFLSMLTGKSIEEISFESQNTSVSKVRGALTQYYEYTGSYPNSLDDLLKKRSEVVRSEQLQQDTENAWMIDNDYYKEQPFLRLVPNDVYTKSPYQYQSSGTDYTLTYTVKLPTFTNKSNPRDYYTTYGSDQSYNSWYYSSSYDASGNTSLLVLKFKNGENTATKSRISETSNATTDTDGDGLADELEKFLGTSITKTDTDGDGYSDQKEILSNSNPLGSGSLGSDYDSFIF